MADNDDVRRIALSFPEVTEGDGGYAVNGKGFAWRYMEKVPGQKGRVRHDDVLACRTANVEEKLIVLDAYPTKTFTDAHYNGFPAVLVRLTEVDTEDLTQFLTDAWRAVAPRKLVKAFDAATATTVLLSETAA